MGAMAQPAERLSTRAKRERSETDNIAGSLLTLAAEAAGEDWDEEVAVSSRAPAAPSDPSRRGGGWGDRSARTMTECSSAISDPRCCGLPLSVRACKSPVLDSSASLAHPCSVHAATAGALHRRGACRAVSDSLPGHVRPSWRRVPAFGGGHQQPDVHSVQGGGQLLEGV